VRGLYDYEAQLRRYEALLTANRSTIPQRWDGGPTALCTLVDLGREEAEQV